MLKQIFSLFPFCRELRFKKILVTTKIKEDSITFQKSIIMFKSLLPFYGTNRISTVLRHFPENKFPASINSLKTTIPRKS